MRMSRCFYLIIENECRRTEPSVSTRDRTALLSHFTELVDDGALAVRLDGDPLTDPHEIEDVMADGLERALANLARAALLVG